MAKVVIVGCNSSNVKKRADTFLKLGYSIVEPMHSVKKEYKIVLEKPKLKK